jgi:hypothetical protein
MRRSDAPDRSLDAIVAMAADASVMPPKRFPDSREKTSPRQRPLSKPSPSATTTDVVGFTSWSHPVPDFFHHA